MVAPSATASERAKNGMPRLAFSEPSIGSTTTCVAPPAPNARSPSSSEISMKSPPMSSSRRTIAASDAASMATVSSPPWPAPTTGSRSTRVGSSASTPRTSSTAARQVASQSVKWLKEKSGRQLGIEVGGLLRQHLALARAREHFLDPRRPEQERRRGLAAVDGCNRLAPLRRVGDALQRQRVDDLDVEQEDRLELCPRRPQQPETPLYRPRVRALVRQDDPLFVGLDSQRNHEPIAGPRHPVRAGVGLRQRPDHRFGLAFEHAVGLPLRELARGLLFRLRQGQVDDVVRVERQIARALLR